MDQGKNGQALATQEERDKKQYRDKNQDHGKSRSKSRSKKDIKCYCYSKSRHVKKDCFKWKPMQKKKEGKGEEKKDNNKGKEKVEEVNTVTYKDDDEVLHVKSSYKCVGGSRSELWSRVDSWFWRLVSCNSS